jgi:hypothetical protein
LRGLVERDQLARKLHELDHGRKLAELKQIDKAEQRGEQLDPLKRDSKIGRLAELALVELGELRRI